MNRRVLSFALALILVMGLIPTTVFAVDEGVTVVPPVEIMPDYSWYGDGSAAEFMISSAEDLVGLANIANGNDGQTKFDFANKTVTLTADITFAENQYWYFNDGNTVYDYQIKNFAGDFNGNNKTIKGLKVYAAVKPSTTVGLFGTIEASGSINALTLDAVTAEFNFTKDTLYRGTFGFIAYNLNGSATDCHINNVTVKGNKYAALREGGAMFGTIRGTVTDCTGTNITIDLDYDGINLNYYSLEDTGCLFGTISVGATVTGCKATTVAIDLGEGGYSKKIGGFTGKVYGGATVEDCAAEDVTLSAYYLYYAGGFVGHCENGGSSVAQTLNNCSVEDVKITTIRAAKIVGGFVGEAANGSNFTNCDAADVTMNIATGVADGTVTSKSQGAMGGFAGQTNSSSTNVVFDGCDLTGLDMTVAGDLEGGIGAFIASTGASATFTGCTTEGTIDAEKTNADDAIGGFIGNLGWGGTPAVSIDQSSAAVDIVANGPVGGFVAKADSNSSTATPTLTMTNSTASGDVTSLNSTADTFVGIGNTVVGIGAECVGTGKVTVYPVAAIGDTEYISLADAFAAAQEGDIINILRDVQLSSWTSVDVKKAMILNGNGHTISGLSAPLVNNASADLEIKDLTISGANINVKSAAGADNDTASAALVQWANGGTLTITNVTVKDSTIKGDGYVAAYVGFVDSTSKGVVVNGGSIENVTLVAGGTVGAVAGHTYADVTVNGISVSGNSLTSNSDGGTRPDKVGLVVGRLSADTVSISATVEGTNTVYPVGDGNAHRVIGSIPGGTAVLTGGSYPTDPTVTGKAGESVSVDEDYKLEQNADGSYSVATKREFVVTTDKDSYAFGETVTVTVTLNGKNLAGAEWTLVYDETLFELVSGEINGNKYVTGTELFAESEVMATYTFKVIGKAVENQDLRASFTVTDTKAQTRIEAVENMVYVSSVTPKEVTLTPPAYLVEVAIGDASTDYVAGKKLVIVYTNSDVVSYRYAGKMMYDVSDKYSKEGYAKAFAIVVDAISEGTLADYEVNVKTEYKTVSDAYVITKGSGYDLNGSGDVELGDVIVVYGVYNAYTSYFENNMDAVLKADVNHDGRVDAMDASMVVEEYNK